jgi:hypothetical protein
MLPSVLVWLFILTTLVLTSAAGTAAYNNQLYSSHVISTLPIIGRSLRGGPAGQPHGAATNTTTNTTTNSRSSIAPLLHDISTGQWRELVLSVVVSKHRSLPTPVKVSQIILRCPSRPLYLQFVLSLSLSLPFILFLSWVVSLFLSCFTCFPSLFHCLSPVSFLIWGFFFISAFKNYFT